MVETAHVKYLFLDIVAFTKDRSVEAQSDLVSTLNDIVKQALAAVGAPPEHTILLPTGDGMAVALADFGAFDIHVMLGVQILRLISEHNEKTIDPMRRFEVRMGINENVDNVVLDINGRRNVAGHGISMAQRIMDKADAGQILLGNTVYETLRPREKYMSSFRSFTATGKHSATFSAYQFVAKDVPGLNVSVPSAFATRSLEPAKFTKLVAYYVAHAAANRSFLMSRNADAVRDDTATVLLWFLAEDSVQRSDTLPYETPTTRTWMAGSATFEEQYRHYYEMDFWPMAMLAELLEQRHLARYSEYFETAHYTKSVPFVKPSALSKLQKEWPQIANEFGIVVVGD